MVTYYFYHNRILKRNTTSVRIGNYKDLLGSISSLFVNLLGLSRISHVLVEIHTEHGSVFVHSIRGKNTEWSTTPPTREPDIAITEIGSLDTTLLDLLLPTAEPYRLSRTILFGLIGYPRYTINCVTVVHRIRLLMGRNTKARTPGGLYRELRQQKQVLHQ